MPGKDEQVLERAELKLSEGNFKGAYRDFKSLTKKMPDNPEVYYGLAESALALPEVSAQEILLNYKKAVELQGENSLYLTGYANYCLETGMLDRAEELYRKAAEVDTENATQYLSDLATGIYIYGKNFVGKIPSLTMDEIYTRSLQIFLDAIGLSRDRALNLLKGG